MNFSITSYSELVTSEYDIEQAKEIRAKKVFVSNVEKGIAIILDEVPEIIADKFIKHESLEYIPRTMIYLSAKQALTLSKMLKSLAKYKLKAHKGI